MMNIFFNCVTTKKIQDVLEVTHIGTTQVKASKVHVFMLQYKMFKIEEGESIKDMT